MKQYNKALALDPHRTELDQPRALIGLISLLVMGPMFFLLMPLYIGALVDYLGLSEAQAGLLTSLELLGTSAAAVMAVFWIRRLSWRHVAAYSAVALSLGNLLCVFFAHDPVLLIGLRLITGFAAGCLVSLACAGLGDTLRTDRNFAFGVVGQLALSGALFMVLPTMIFRFGASAIFACFAACAIVALIGGLLLPSSSRRRSVAPLVEKRAWKPIWGLLGGAAFFIANTAVWAYIERIGVASELKAGFIGNVLGIAVFTSILGPLLAARAAQRFNRFWIMLIALMGELVCLIFLRIGMGAVSYAAIVLLYQLCWNLWVPLQMSVVADVDSSGRFAVLIPLFQAAGIALGPALAASFLATSGYLAVNIIAAVFATLALLLFVPVTLGQQTAEDSK